jgi:hypothetical protein
MISGSGLTRSGTEHPLRFARGASPLTTTYPARNTRLFGQVAQATCTPRLSKPFVARTQSSQRGLPKGERRVPRGRDEQTQIPRTGAGSANRLRLAPRPKGQGGRSTELRENAMVDRRRILTEPAAGRHAGSTVRRELTRRLGMVGDERSHLGLSTGLPASRWGADRTVRRGGRLCDSSFRRPVSR